MPLRAIVVWVGVVALMAVLSASGPSLVPGASLIVAVVVAGVVASGARQSVVLASVRAGRWAVDTEGRTLGSLAATTVAAMTLAGGLVWTMGRRVDLDAPVAVALGGACALACALAWPRRGPIRSRSMSLASFLARGAALAATMAAAMGAVVAVGRFGLEGVVPPGAFCRVLAGTFLCDALLGVGGFARARTALGCHVVRVPLTRVPEVPGPVLLALVAAAPTVLVLPSVLPTIAATTAVAIKIVAGAIVGGVLHLAGGLRGAALALALPRAELSTTSTASTSV
jgi:hypothetical protein